MERTSQPGVSRALARLEAEVGTPLLRRHGRALRMTHAGVAFKHHVDAMMHSLDDGLAAVQQLVDPEAGTVTLSYQRWLGSWLVPDLVGSFRAEHARVRVNLRPKRDELVTSVPPRGDVDLEISSRLPSRAGTHWRRLLREPLLLALPAGHPLASRTGLSLADVAELSFVALPPTSLLRGVCDELCAAAGFEPRVAFECEDVPALLGFVAAGLGVALVPARTAGYHESSRVALVRTSDPGTELEVGITWSSERSLLPAAELLRAHAVSRAAAGLLPQAASGR